MKVLLYAVIAVYLCAITTITIFYLNSPRQTIPWKQQPMRFIFCELFLKMSFVLSRSLAIGNKVHLVIEATSTIDIQSIPTTSTHEQLVFLFLNETKGMYEHFRQPSHDLY